MGGDFKQRTGLIGFHSEKFNMMYENDGGIGIKHLRLGDRNDSFRTAALNLSWGGFSGGFNLSTGRRDLRDQLEETNNYGIDYKDRFGIYHKNASVNEIGPKYRLGALTMGYGNYRIGVNSEHVRHAIQNSVIHRMINDNEFMNISWNWNSYTQSISSNIFTSW